MNYAPDDPYPYMKKLEIGGKAIGPDQPTYVIAEAGINHNGNLEAAKELVNAAVTSGADAVKFQKRSIKKTYLKRIVESPSVEQLQIEYTVSNLKEALLSDEEFRELAVYARRQDITFLCTPWDIESVDFLESIPVPAYKVGSPDMTNFVLLERVTDAGRPVVISTGMATEKEISRTVEFLEDRGASYAILHCRSTYPAPYHNINLRYMDELMDRYDVPIGYSGHERGIAVTEAAVARGATIVERHLTIDRAMEGLDHNASLEPNEFRQLVGNIRDIESSLGEPIKYMTRGEYNNRLALGKSLVTTKRVASGTRLTRDQVTAKSPGRGISPQYLYDVMGSRITETLEPEAILQWDHMEGADHVDYDVDLRNWGVVVRFSDIADSDWGTPDIFEFRINGADLEVDIEKHLHDTEFDKLLGVHAPIKMGHELVNLSARDEAKRLDAVDVIQQTIDLTRNIIKPRFRSDSPYIIVHPGGITEDERDTNRIPAMNVSLQRSMDELDDDGVSLLIENIPPLPWMWGGQYHHNNFLDAEEIADFCVKTGQKLCYDTSHAKLWCNYSGNNFENHARTLAPHVQYLHLSDAAGIDGEGLQIGEGEIDFQILASVFSDFEGPIVTEIWRGHERDGEGFKKAAARLSEFF